MIVKVLILAVFVIVTVGVGLYFRSRVNDVSGFVLGGRSVGPWLTAFAYGTSYFSAVIFVGYAGQFGWRFGVASTWIGLGNAFVGSLLAWIVLGKRTNLMTRKLGSSTMPEFFGQRYNSVGMKLASSAIIFIFLIPYTASLYNGLSRLFAMAFNIDYSVCIIAMAVLTGVYVVAGGYVATAVNDFIQGIVMLGGIVAVIAAVLRVNGGFTASMEALALVSDAETTSMNGAFASFLGPDPMGLLSVTILTSLGTWGLPQMVQKFYAIKSEKAISKGALISTVFAIVIAGGCYFLGGFGRIFTTPEVVARDGFDSIIPAMLSGMPPLLMGIIVILVLSASMSTLSALVLTSSSTLTLDFIKGHVIKELDEKKQLVFMRVLVVVFIAISCIIALVQYSGGISFIAQLMGISWGTLAGAFLAPFMYGLYSRRISRASVWCCFIFAVVLMVSNIFFRSSFPVIIQSPINCGAFAMLAGLVIVPVVSLFTKKTEKEVVDNAFSCFVKED